MRGGVACLETTRAHTCGCARIAWKAWTPSTRASPGVASAVLVIGHVASTTAKAAVTYIARHAMKPTPEKTGASAAAPMISLSQPVISLMPCRSRPPQRNSKNGRGTTSSNSTRGGATPHQMNGAKSAAETGGTECGAGSAEKGCARVVDSYAPGDSLVTEPSARTAPTTTSVQARHHSIPRARCVHGVQCASEIGHRRPHCFSCYRCPAKPLPPPPETPALSMGFEEHLAKHPALVKACNDYQKERVVEPDRAPAHSEGELIWMERFVHGNGQTAPRGEVTGRLRLRCQTSTRHDDLRRTAVAAAKWAIWGDDACRGPLEQGGVRGLVSRACATTTIARPGAAPRLGATAEGDAWLGELVGLWKTAHVIFATDVFAGLVMNDKITEWIQSPATGEFDARNIRRIMREQGWTVVHARRFRLHQAKVTIVSLGLHHDLSRKISANTSAVRVQRGWRARRESYLQGTGPPSL
jgi:hypothetical protein